VPEERRPASADSRSSRLRTALAPHWKGHVLWFDPAPIEPYAAASGWRLLLIVGLVEGVLGPRLGLLQWLGLEVPPAWARVPLLFAVVLALVRWFVGVEPSRLGLRRWATWGTTERSYFVQVFVLANVIFATIFAEPVAALLGNRALWGPGVVVLITSLLWGFYQELIYRGILQTELGRRWGALGGILAANTLYTFGPLHLYHFAGGTLLGSFVMFAGIFAIGLFFGLLFHRSANLWIVGTFHGLGDWYIVGVSGLVG
jgi:membrane protease YdiL (CAAX protease family)